MIVKLPAATGNLNVPMLSEFGYMPMESAKFIYLLTGANIQQALIDRSGNHLHGSVDTVNDKMSYSAGIISATNDGGSQINNGARLTGPNFTFAVVAKQYDTDTRDIIRFANQTFGVSIRTGNNSFRAVYFDPTETITQPSMSGILSHFSGFQFQIMACTADKIKYARNFNRFIEIDIQGGATENIPNNSLVQIGFEQTLGPYHDFGFFGCWQRTFSDDDRQALYGYVRRLMLAKGVALP